MARRELVVLEDDLTGGDATETIRFGLDGMSYEIDLNSRNAKKLRDSLVQYVQAGRKVGRGGLLVGGRSARSRGGVARDRAQNQAIREWARKNRKPVAERGRIPQEIVDEYHARAGRRAG